jgi:hypothetical protein
VRNVDDIKSPKNNGEAERNRGIKSAEKYTGYYCVYK